MFAALKLPLVRGGRFHLEWTDEEEAIWIAHSMMLEGVIIEQDAHESDGDPWDADNVTYADDYWWRRILFITKSDAQLDAIKEKYKPRSIVLISTPHFPLPSDGCIRYGLRNGKVVRI